MKLVATKVWPLLVSVDHQRAASCALFGYGLYTRDLQHSSDIEVRYSHVGVVGTLVGMLAWLKGEEVPERILRVYDTPEGKRGLRNLA